MRVERTQLQAGIWEIDLESQVQPEPEIRHEGAVLGGVELEPLGAGHWRVRLELPLERIDEGLQLFVLSDHATGAVIAELPLVAGTPAAADMAVQLAELRAELDLLKQVVRQLHS